jgi:hypothetical protein
MKYELAKELKDAGFPQAIGQWSLAYDKQRKLLHVVRWKSIDEEIAADDPALDCFAPALEELIEACGVDFSYLAKADNGSEWKCATYSYHRHRVTEATGITPDQAVARLWLALHANGDATA